MDFAKRCLEGFGVRIICSAKYVGKRVILHKQRIPPLSVSIIFPKIRIISSHLKGYFLLDDLEAADSL